MDLVATQSKRIMKDQAKLEAAEDLQFAAFSSGWFARGSLGHYAPVGTEALKNAYNQWIELDSETQ